MKKPAKSQLLSFKLSFITALSLHEDFSLDDTRPPLQIPPESERSADWDASHFYLPAHTYFSHFDTTIFNNFLFFSIFFVSSNISTSSQLFDI